MYRAGVLAAATVDFVSTGSGVSTSTRIRRIVEAPESALALDWEKATTLEATLEGSRPAALPWSHLRSLFPRP